MISVKFIVPCYWLTFRHIHFISSLFNACSQLQNRPVPLVPNLQTLPPTWSGQRRDPSGYFSAADLGDALGNISSGDPRAGPASAQAQYNQNGISRQAASREQEEARQFERQSLPRVLISSADSIPCNAYFYSPTLAQPQLLSVSSAILSLVACVPIIYGGSRRK